MNRTTIKELMKMPGRLWNILIDSRGKAFLVIPDYIFLKIRTGLEFNEYFNFEFEKQDKDFRKAYLNTKQKLRYLGYLNSRQKYYILARNKYFTHLLMNQLGIPTAQLLYYYDPGFGAEGERFSGKRESVKKFILLQQLEDFVIKPTEGTWGKGVMVYKKGFLEGERLILQQWNDKLVDLTDLLGEEPLIFEKKICQTMQLNMINPSSLNSIRTYTAIYPDGSVKMIAPEVKFGRINACISNASNGNSITAALDMETGIIHSVIHFIDYRNIISITHHPDTGQQIEGIIIDQWDKIKEQVIEFQQKIPFIKVIGWDIAVTDRGAVVIEMNDLFDNIGQLISHKGWKKDISDCYDAWTNNYIRK